MSIMHEPQPPQRYSGAEKSPRLQRSVHFNSSNKQETAPPVIDGGDDIMANVQAKIPFLLDLLNKAKVEREEFLSTIANLKIDIQEAQTVIEETSTRRILEEHSFRKVLKKERESFESRMMRQKDGIAQRNELLVEFTELMTRLSIQHMDNIPMDLFVKTFKLAPASKETSYEIYSRACDEVSLGGDDRQHKSGVLEALAEIFNPDGEQSLERSRTKAKRRKVRKGARGTKSKQQRAMQRLESGDDIAFPETHDDAREDEDGEEGADFFEEASDYVAAVSAYSHYDDSAEGGEGDPQEAASSTNPEMGIKAETTKKVKTGGGVKLPKLGIKLKGSKEKGKALKHNGRVMGNGAGDGDEEEWLDDDGDGSLDGITIITEAGSTTHPADAFQTSATFSQYEKLRIIQDMMAAELAANGTDGQNESHEQSFWWDKVIAGELDH